MEGISVIERLPLAKILISSMQLVSQFSALSAYFSSVFIRNH
jgi:hypothetical protein